MRSREELRGELSIGDLAAEYGIAAHVLRHWEEVGVLLPARRRGGQRRYTERQRHRLEVILLAQRAGMTLKQIREVMESTRVEERRALLTSHLAELEERMARLQEARQIVEEGMVCPHERHWDQPCGAEADPSPPPAHRRAAPST